MYNTYHGERPFIIRHSSRQSKDVELRHEYKSLL